ncbi:MAG: pilus assembly protein PilP [Gammaproteobacteria bacterium]|nr:pilus assembly protein PilP [Gammaproteobacteria bacterium]
MIQINRLYGPVAALIATLAIGACSVGGNTEDLKQYVLDIKSRKGQVRPLPEFKAAEGFVYPGESLKDPFVSWEKDVAPVMQATVSGRGKGGKNRPQEPLEAFPLDTLRMVGALKKRDSQWALVKASDGVIYRVGVGSHVGQNQGRVTQVTEEKVSVMEMVADGLGSWEEREAFLTLVGKE